MSVPRAAKWALYAKCTNNMRRTFTPHDGHLVILNFEEWKDHSILTSIVWTHASDAVALTLATFIPSNVNGRMFNAIILVSMILSICRLRLHESPPNLDVILLIIPEDGLLQNILCQSVLDVVVRFSVMRLQMAGFYIISISMRAKMRLSRSECSLRSTRGLRLSSSVLALILTVPQ